MLALVKSAPVAGLELVDIAVPQIGPSDVLVKVSATGICGTDLHIEAWDAWAQKAVAVPVTVGHEFSGVVADVGSSVTEVAVGDRVSGEGHVVCGRCRNCRAGRRHLCIHTRAIGVQLDGAFAEYVALPAGNVWVHKDPVPSDVAAIFDPFGNAVHTALAFPMLGEDVLVTGAGPIGIMAAMVSQARRGPARGDHRREPGTTRAGRAARRHQGGGHHRGPASPRRSASSACARASTSGLEMSGSPAALRDMIGQMTHGGRIAMLGLPGRGDQRRLRHGGAEHADHQGDLRPGDVRDLVRDVGAGPRRPRHLRGDHRPVLLPRPRRRRSPPPATGTPAK